MYWGQAQCGAWVVAQPARLELATQVAVGTQRKSKKSRSAKSHHVHGKRQEALALWRPM